MKLSEVLNAALETGRRDVARRQKKKQKKPTKKPHYCCGFFKTLFCTKWKDHILMISQKMENTFCVLASIISCNGRQLYAEQPLSSDHKNSF